LVELVMLY